MLAKKAGESGMCEADYLRLLISQKPNDYPEVRELLKELINEVNRIGININQIVFNNNAGLYSKEDKTQLVAYMRKLNKKVNEAGLCQVIVGNFPFLFFYTIIIYFFVCQINPVGFLFMFFNRILS